MTGLRDYLRVFLDRGIAADAVRSVQKLRALATRTDALVVTGHDPDAWPTFRHAPEFYA